MAIMWCVCVCVACKEKMKITKRVSHLQRGWTVRWLVCSDYWMADARIYCGFQGHKSLLFCNLWVIVTFPNKHALTYSGKKSEREQKKVRKRNEFTKTIIKLFSQNHIHYCSTKVRLRVVYVPLTLLQMRRVNIFRLEHSWRLVIFHDVSLN